MKASETADIGHARPHEILKRRAGDREPGADVQRERVGVHYADPRRKSAVPSEAGGKVHREAALALRLLGRGHTDRESGHRWVFRPMRVPAAAIRRSCD